MRQSRPIVISVRVSGLFLFDCRMAHISILRKDRLGSLLTVCHCSVCSAAGRKSNGQLWSVSRHGISGTVFLTMSTDQVWQRGSEHGRARDAPEKGALKKICTNSHKKRVASRETACQGNSILRETGEWKTVLNYMQFPWQAVSRLATQERQRWKNDRFHHGDTMAGLFLREGHVQRGACWISVCVFSFRVCFCFSFLFLFCFCFCLFSSLLLLFSFSISLSVACLSASSLFLRGTQTWHLARFIAHRKLYSSLSFFSSKPIKYRNCCEKCKRFSKLSDDRPWSWNRR